MLEKQSKELDLSDKGDNDKNWRSRALDLGDRDRDDNAQYKLLDTCEQKLKSYHELMFNYRKLSDMGSVAETNHKSYFNWIMNTKPLGSEQYNWIYEAYDHVPLIKVNSFETSILATSLRKLFSIRKNASSDIVHYSPRRITACVKLIYVLLAVAIMTIPVFLLQWVAMSRAWESITMLFFIIGFSPFLSLGTEVQIQFVLVGTAAYWAVLVTLLSNLPPVSHR